MQGGKLLAYIGMETLYTPTTIKCHRSATSKEEIVQTNFLSKFEVHDYEIWELEREIVTRASQLSKFIQIVEQSIIIITMWK